MTKAYSLIVYEIGLTELPPYLLCGNEKKVPVTL